MSDTIKTKLTEALKMLLAPSSRIIRVFKEDDLGPYFGPIYFWQEIKKYAESAHEAAWKTAQKAKVVPDDDALRDMGEGEHIIADSRLFSFIAKVDKPRDAFDLEKFCSVISKRFKVDEAALSKLAADCQKQSKSPLSKRILEVQK